MGGVALLYDAIQIIFVWMGIGWLIIPIFYIHFWMWFRMHGIKFFTKKRAKSFGIGAVLEILTAGIVPAFTFNVISVALDYKIKSAGKTTP